MDAQRPLGTINRYLIRLGLVDPFEPIIWLADPVLAMFSVIVVGTWFRFPFMMITVLAARRDPRRIARGSVARRREHDSALPGRHVAANHAGEHHCHSVAGNLDLQRLCAHLRADGGGPANATTPLILMAYREAFQRFNIGYGTSLAVISMVLMLAVGTVYLRLQSRQDAAA